MFNIQFPHNMDYVLFVVRNPNEKLVIKILTRYYIPFVLIFVLFAGCINTEDGTRASKAPEVTISPTPTPSAAVTVPAPSPTAAVQHTEIVQKIDEKAQVSLYENKSVAVEVNYRKYVDWFRDYNLNIRSYTPQEYVCGQYTVDMINASEKAGYKAYFAAVRFSDGTGHAIVSFKSTFGGFTSWYFFEPQTNNLLTPETLQQELGKNMGKQVTEVNIYGYFDDAGDNDPTTWRFAYPLYNKKY
ncbi:MAG: hypothetical protein PHU34_05300 [Candidatus Methanoperedens sp.]|nr:hypothetical protein [Candidatus Methanoperedens sp.]